VKAALIQAPSGKWGRDRILAAEEKSTNCDAHPASSLASPKVVLENHSSQAEIIAEVSLTITDRFSHKSQNCVEASIALYFYSSRRKRFHAGS
jgi:hypothetical protein